MLGGHLEAENGDVDAGGDDYIPYVFLKRHEGVAKKMELNELDDGFFFGTLLSFVAGEIQQKIEK